MRCASGKSRSVAQETEEIVHGEPLMGRTGGEAGDHRLTTLRSALRPALPWPLIVLIRLNSSSSVLPRHFFQAAASTS